MEDFEVRWVVGILWELGFSAGMGWNWESKSSSHGSPD